MRQCDVWVNAKIGGHWPISILISCKDHNQKLDVGDIGAFNDEVRSTSASTGVIYSRAGFSEPALEKAVANGLSCCKLFQNQPPQLPAKLWFDSFACSAKMGLFIVGDNIPSQLSTWDDLFSISFANGESVLDLLQETYHKFESAAVSEITKTGQFPNNWAVDINLSSEEPERPALVLRIEGIWKKYRGRVEASFINGSYCFNNDSFAGTQSTPFIDTKSTHPGEGWLEIQEANFSMPSNRIIAILYRPPVAQILKAEMGPKLIRGTKPSLAG